MSADNFEARVLERDEYGLWDRLAIGSPQGTIFHHSDFMQIVAKASSTKLKIYGCFQNNELVGGCSLYSKGWDKAFSRATSTAPLAPYGGFLFPPLDDTNVRKSESVRNDITNALCDRIREDRYFSVAITNSPDLLDIRPCLWRGWEGQVAYAYYLDLEGDFTGRFSKSVRKEVRKASDAGLFIERFDDAALHHELLTQLFNSQGMDAPVGRVFFTAMLDLFAREKCGGMWVARDSSNNILASRIWIWDEKRAYAWSGASDQEFRDSGANQFLFVSLLEEMQKKGFRQVNIMQGNTKRLGYHAAGYNPILIPYYKIYKNNLMFDVLRCIKRRG